MSIDIIDRAFQALTSGDPERISRVLPEAAEWLSPPGNAVAVALEAPDHMVGREAIVRFFTEDFPRLFARGVDVAVRGAHADGGRATLEANVKAALPGGGRYDVDYCFVFELRGGLVHRVREYADTARAHRMVSGGVPPRPSAPEP